MYDHPLLEAIAEGDLDAIEAIVKRGIDLGRRISVYGSPLWFAITVDRIDSVTKLLDLGASPNGVPGEDPPLHAAVLQKNEPVVRLLLARGADPNVKDPQGSNPLVTAAAVGSLTLTRLLLDAGADPLAKNRFKVDAVEAAKTGAGAKIVKLLTGAAGATKSATMSFVDAARFGHAARVAELVPTANAQDRESALFEAIQGGHRECVRVLVDAGADVNRPIRSGDRQLRHPAQAPLLQAIHAGKADVVALLLEHGADPNATAAGPHVEGVTALMMAAAQRDPAIARRLLEAGANPALRDKHGRSALAQARQVGYKRVIKVLEAVSGSGASALTLHEAATDGHADRVRELVAAGAAIDATDARGLTPLAIAVAQGHEGVVTALLDAGANAKLAGPEAGRLWQQALGSKASGATVRALLAAGLDPNARVSPEGMTPLMFAAGFGGDDVVAVLEALLAAGAQADATYQPEPPKELAALAKMRSALLPKLPKAKPMTAADFARQMNNRRAREFLAGRSDAPASPYDAMLSRMKSWKDREATTEPLARAIAKRFGGRAIPWKRRRGVFYISASPEAVTRELEAAAADARSAQALLVHNKQAASSGDRAGLLLFPTNEPLEVMAACGTNAANYGLGTREVVAWFEEVRVKWPFEVVGCGFDFVDVVFGLPVADPRELVKRIFEFCPDAREDSDTAAAAELASDGRCFFWWD